MAVSIHAVSALFIGPPWLVVGSSVGRSVAIRIIISGRSQVFFMVVLFVAIYTCFRYSNLHV